MRHAEIFGRADQPAVTVFRHQLEAVGQRHVESGDKRIVHNVGGGASVGGRSAGFGMPQDLADTWLPLGTRGVLASGPAPADSKLRSVLDELVRSELGSKVPERAAGS